MPTLPILQYRASWDMNHHFGVIQLRAENGSWSPSKKFDNPQEFCVVLDLLRNEKPIFHDVNHDRIKTSAEAIGEDE